MTELYQREGAYIPRVAGVHEVRPGYGDAPRRGDTRVGAAGVDAAPRSHGPFSAHTNFPLPHRTTPLGSRLTSMLGVRDTVHLDGVYSGFSVRPNRSAVIQPP